MMTRYPYTTLNLRGRTANRIDVLGDVIHGTDRRCNGEPIPGAKIDWAATRDGEPCVWVVVAGIAYWVFNRDGRCVVETERWRTRSRRGYKTVPLAALEREVATARKGFEFAKAAEGAL